MVRPLTIALLLAWLAAPGTADAQQRYSADRFDVDLALARDGSMRVAETVVFRFEGGSFTEVFRRIPTRRTDGIVGLSGTIDGLNWPPPGGEGRFRVDRENGVQAIWRFPETRDATRTFGLTYTARGVIERQDESDVFAWFVLPTDHKYSITESRVDVRWPQGGQPIGMPLVTPSGAEVETYNGGFVVTARDLAPDAVFRVTVRFVAGSLVDTMPEWQARGVRGRAIAPVVAAVAGLILAAGLAWLFVFWNSYRRQPLAAQHALPLSAPPGTLPPALAGTLVSPMSGATLLGFFGTLLNLARRGAVQIEESPARKWPRSRAFDVALGQRPPGLRPHEQVALDLLFAPKSGPRDRVHFSDVVKAARSGWKPFKGAVADELVREGLVSTDRKRTRNRVTGIGVALLVIGGLSFVPAGILTRTYSAWPLIVPAAVELLGLLVLIVGMNHSILTDDGRRLAAGWKEHARHLKTIARLKAPMPDSAMFEEALAFATAAGLGGSWVKAFRKSGNLTATPAWFKAASAADAAGQLDAFAAMIGGVHAAGRSGSGGGAGGASAGGGGASGAR